MYIVHTFTLVERKIMKKVKFVVARLMILDGVPFSGFECFTGQHWRNSKYMYISIWNKRTSEA
jgi:hypothetical protein